MKRAYRNETYDRATSAVAKEWRNMAKLAVIIREKNCNPIWADQMEEKFTGIFRRLLEDPLEEVIKEAGMEEYAERY